LIGSRVETGVSSYGYTGFNVHSPTVSAAHTSCSRPGRSGADTFTSAVHLSITSRGQGSPRRCDLVFHFFCPTPLGEVFIGEVKRGGRFRSIWPHHEDGRVLDAQPVRTGRQRMEGGTEEWRNGGLRKYFRTSTFSILGFFGTKMGKGRDSDACVFRHSASLSRTGCGDEGGGRGGALTPCA
jgi:hypothetical protein